MSGKNKKGPKPSAAPPSGAVVAFAVLEVDGQHVPMRLVLDAQTKFEATPLHEPTVYEALAYEYLQGDVLEHWRSVQVSRSVPTKPPAPAPTEEPKP
jgi:hypothetical protein